jgi:hypothetical protein
MPRLFAVLLGGNCRPRSNTELHDVVFVAGETLEDTHDDLLEAWFGTPEGLHVDAWVSLDHVDGHRVTLQREPAAGEARLYFVNLGGYLPRELQERHANTFVVATSPAEAKRRARTALLQDHVSVHTDDLHDVDDCLEIGQASGWHVRLEPAAGHGEDLQVHNGWMPLPEETIAAFVARRSQD